MRRLAAVAAACLAAAGCVAPAEPLEEPTPQPSVCEEEVVPPPGINAGQAVPLAEAHEEVYGEAPTPFQVRIQWPARDPSRSVAFLWRSDVATLASAVELWTADGEPRTWLGSSFTFGGAAQDHARIHEVRLCGRLEPGTTYRYRVGGASAWSAQYEFATPPEPGSFGTVRIGIAGDSRGGYETWATVVQAMEQHAPDIYLFSGDMVEIGTAQAEWDAWFDAAGEIWTRKPMVPAIGNHELLSRNYFAQFAMPGNEEWFSLDYGPLHLTSLNDIVPRYLSDITVTQPGYLAAELAATAATWKVTLHHWSAWSSSRTHRSNTRARDSWCPVQDRYAVDLDVAAHNHLYERSVPIRDGQEAAPGRGTVYLTSGGAGGPIYSGIDETWWQAAAVPVLHYVIADFAGNTATLTARDLDGNVIDEVSWTK